MANSTKPGLLAVVTAALTDLFSVRQSGDTRDKKLSTSQLKALLLATGSTDKAALRASGTGGATTQGSDLVIADVAGGVLSLTSSGSNILNLPTFISLGAGVGLRNNSGDLEVRNATNSAYGLISADTHAALNGVAYGAKLHSTQGLIIGSSAFIFFSNVAGLGGITNGDSAFARSAAAAIKVTDGSSGVGSINALRPPTSAAGAATITQLPTAGEYCIHKNTTTGFVHLAYNDGGTIKSVQLT